MDFYMVNENKNKKGSVPFEWDSGRLRWRIETRCIFFLSSADSMLPINYLFCVCY